MAPSSGKIGRFEILGILGQGSMGVVYEAHDPQLDRDVAIKTFQLPQNLDEQRLAHLRTSLLHEARMVAGLTHPGIVQVHDAGEHGNLAYIVMERIEGRPLDELLAEKGALDPDYALRLMRELLEAMACAHGRGIIHRDLKPGNIIVQRDGHGHVTDFGVAHALAEQPTGGAPRLVGTPRYMAPEQINMLPTDQRSDVFSLGVIFFELLAGQRPFPQGDIAELREAITNRPHPPLHVLRPNLPPEVCDLVNRALAKEPADRFASAGQMLEALRQFMDGRKAQAPLSEESRRDILDFIRQRIERQGDFPAASEYVAAVTHAAHLKNSSASLIAEAVLKDFSLTNRILRMVNSPFYRGRGSAIRTISRAVVILGVDTVLSIVAGLGIFEHFHQRSDLPALKALSIQALMTALHARQIAQQVGYEEPEEAFICGMLHHLGLLLVAYYFPDEYRAIQDIMGQGETDEERASRQVMRLSYSELGRAMAEAWHMPEVIVDSIVINDDLLKERPRTALQMLQNVVACARDLGKATMMNQDDERRLALTDLCARFEGRIRLTRKSLEQFMDNSIRNAWDISHALRVDLKSLGIAERLMREVSQPDDSPTVDDREPKAEGRVALDERSPSLMLEDPPDEPGADDSNAYAAMRQDIVMKTISEITMTLMSPFQLNDILMMVLEGIFRGVGFQHVLIAMIDPANAQVVCRFGLGPRIDQIRELFKFPLGGRGKGGVVAACIEQEKEILITDLTGFPGSGISQNLMQLLNARAILLLPIIVSGKPIGVFFVDRSPDQPPIRRPELRDLRTLAGQAALAIQQSIVRR